MQFLLRNPHMDLLRLPPYVLQHWGSSLKGTSGMQEGTEMSGIKARAGGSFLPDRKGFRATEPAGWCHI